MSTKEVIAAKVFKEMRISGITVIPDGGQIEDCIDRMDLMVAGWNDYALCIGYNKTTETPLDPSQDSGVGTSEERAIVLRLAVEMAPQYGKTPHPVTIAAGKAAYDGLFNIDIGQREATPYQPNGSGHTFGYWYRDRFRYQSYEQNAPVGCDTYNIKTGQTKIYSFDLTGAVGDSTISSYELSTTGGVSVVTGSDSQIDGIFSIEMVGSVVGASTLKITITLATGEIDPVTINFNVTST